MQSFPMISTFHFIEEYINEKLESILLKFDLIKQSPNKIIAYVSKNKLNVCKIYCEKKDCNLFIIYGYNSSGEMVLHDSVSYRFKVLCPPEDEDEDNSQGNSSSNEGNSSSNGGISAVVPNDNGQGNSSSNGGISAVVPNDNSQGNSSSSGGISAVVPND